MLTAEQARETFIYWPRSGLLTWKNTRSRKRLIGVIAGTYEKHGYIRVQVNGSLIRAHRIIWLILHGEWPLEIDHINGDRADNRIENLRAVSRIENRRNVKRQWNNTSGVPGVYLEKSSGRWYAQIWINRKGISLGYYECWWDAVCARKSAEVKYDFHPNHGRN